MFRRRHSLPTPQTLIFGLGNPGPKYAQTRHNAGWWVLDALAGSRQSLGRQAAHKSEAEYVELTDGGKPMVAALIKPQTFMNLSGDCLKAWRRAHPYSKIAVVYDDISLAAGKLRVREKGSAGGHNGVKSIIGALGGDEFLRLKVGVGAPPEWQDSADYVLEPPSEADRAAIKACLALAAAVLEQLATGGLEAANRLLAQSAQS